MVTQFISKQCLKSRTFYLNPRLFMSCQRTKNMPPPFLRRLLLLFLPAALLVCSAAWLVHRSEYRHDLDESAAGERAAMRAGMPMIALGVCRT